VLHHYTVPILTQVLAGHLLLRLPYLGCTTKQGSVLLECLLHMLVQRRRGSFYFLESPKFLPRTLKDLGTVNQEAIIKLSVLKFQASLTQDKIMESVCVPDFTDLKTSGLAVIFLSCHSTRLSRVPASGLKEFYCSNMPLSGPYNN